MTTKKILIQVALLFALIAILLGVSFIVDKTSTSKEAPQTLQAVVPTERFVGSVRGTTIVFEHTDYIQYRHVVDGAAIEGSLNTERGYGTDPDATVYVLNWDGPESEQVYYVKLSQNLDQVLLLDNDRIIVPEVTLNKN